MLKALRGCNALLRGLVLALSVAITAVSAFVIVYNQRVFLKAENVRSSLYDLKPVVDEEGKVDFGQLHEINPDITAWLTVDNTGIDYPVVQGETNMTYMNTDVFGAFSLAGSIFLDSRNDRNMTDKYSIIYGHHMENHLMFGDLDLFKDPDFFEQNRSATILTENGQRDYDVLAFAEIPDSNMAVFDPTRYGGDLSGLTEEIKEYSSNIHQPSMELLESEPTGVSVVALVTCASGNTGIRTVVFLITAQPPFDPGTSSDDTTSEVSDETTSETSDETTSEPSDETTSEPSDETTSEPSDETTSEPSDETTSEPSDETTSETSDETTSDESSEDSSEDSSEPTSSEDSDDSTGPPHVGDDSTGTVVWFMLLVFAVLAICVVIRRGVFDRYRL